MKRLRATGIMARAGAVPFWGLLGAVLAIPLMGGSAGVQQSPAQVSGELPVTAVRQIEELLAEKAQRTPAQRKVSSQLLDAAESAQRLETEGTAQGPETEGIAQRLDTEGITQRLETEDLVAWIIPKDVLSLCFSTPGIT